MTFNNIIINVKKSDGQAQKMTLAEFEEYKNNPRKNLIEVEKDEPIILENNTETESVEPLTSSLPIEQSSEFETKDFSLSKVQTTSITNSTPVKDIFVDEAVYQHKQNIDNPLDEARVNPNVWSEADHESLLAEDVSEVARQPGISTLPTGDFSFISDLIGQLSFPVDEKLAIRLNSLLISWVKG
ncbi:MAG: hypothetical protein WA057_03600, partial [Candidatus Magasanikiibacteriota bacterium]